MRKSISTHKDYCFAGQPAPCPGYFANDALPCVCGTYGDVLAATNLVALPAVPLAQPAAEMQVMRLSA